MATARIKIVGGDGRRPLTGQDVRVLVVTPNGDELLLPAQSLVLRVGSRHEQAIATIEVPAVVVELQLDQSQLATVADVQPGGPESQWEATLGHVKGDRVADVEAYAEPHRELFHDQAPRFQRPAAPAPSVQPAAPIAPQAAPAAPAPTFPRVTPTPEHVEDAAAALRAMAGRPAVDIDAIIAGATGAPTS